jgi:deoxyribose-phosphate aldolase
MTEALPRNNGTPLKPEWFEDVSVNRSASERRAATISARRSVKKEYQAAWLIRAIQCIDLTTLAGDDTAGRVRRSAPRRANHCARTFRKRSA